MQFERHHSITNAWASRSKASMRIWGIGLGENDPPVQDPAQWPGRNLLGSILMEVRRVLLDA